MAVFCSRDKNLTSEDINNYIRELKNKIVDKFVDCALRFNDTFGDEIIAICQTRDLKQFKNLLERFYDEAKRELFEFLKEQPYINQFSVDDWLKCLENFLEVIHIFTIYRIATLKKMFEKRRLPTKILLEKSIFIIWNNIIWSKTFL